MEELFSLSISGAFQEDGVDDPIGIKSEVENQMESLEQGFTAKTEKPFYLIARAGDKIIGTIAYKEASQLISENCEIDLKGIPEIVSVYIHPDFQGKGVGSLLFNQILVCLLHKNIGQFCLDSGYKRAQIFWTTKLGTPTINLKDYWGKDGDHLIWIRNLNEIEIKYDLTK